MMQNLILATGFILVLVLIAVAFMGPNIGKATSRRLGAVKMRHSDSADARVEQQMRKALAARRPMIFTDGRNISRADRLRLRLAQTGKNWTFQQYLSASASITALVMVALWIKGAPLYLSLFGGLMLGAGLPHFVINFLIAKRIKQFTNNFPDAIELLVRGLKSGLPVGETLGMVAKEIPGPVGEEFKMVNEKIRIGKTMEDALQETADRMGTPEFQFFVITLAIQRETGGNLAETLSNLADVLRKRGQMKLKIRAMSSESKASAYIVGSLPFFVFGMVWSVNQKYLAGFFFEPRLMIAGIIGIVWMSIGAFIMAKMVNFEI
ncbi:type II secretion system F family protein [Sphingorhabdus sp. IMCC26285]|uniref:Type II secretion system F family protein n=1 Tax=Sphingorhabdus profundilacus TaxID=2509718 RepID=A0A6I4M495_9SPHN|nr:type II secretion system F family protein [Sphingorhabdus profundilacus]